MARAITFITNQWGDYTLDAVCRVASQFGYDGLELSGGVHIDVQRAAKDICYANSVVETLSQFNLSCWAISGHLCGQCVGDMYDIRLDNFVPKSVQGKPKAIQEWAINEICQTARAANNIGAGIVTGFMGSPVWKFWYSFPQTTDKMIDNAYDEIYELWTPIFDVFDECGIRFALEVHPTEIAFDYYTTERLLKRFNYRKTLGINFDPSHLLWQGVNPAVFVRDFRDYIVHVHMKDVAISNDDRSGILGSHLAFGDTRRKWNFRTLGRGNVNFEEIIRELNNAGYSGPLSVEWEDSGMDRITGLKESIDFVRKYNFSASEVAFDAAIANKDNI